nr:hypothetical protein [Tanacetum cinerariifolium]
SRQASASESAFIEEPLQTTSQMEEPSHPEFEIGADDQPIVQSSQHPECKLAKQADSRSSFNELLDTPLDFSNFIMNRLRVDTLTPEILAGPTYELMKGSCKSLIELEYHLEEPLPLIPDNRGRRVIPFAHFINNDLEYLRGGASSRKYTTPFTKMKAADYGHMKWIEDLVPRTMWIQEPIDYDKYALWGVSHWGRKRQQFYDFAVNRESALDITVRRDDDKLYKFKEGDFKRLRLQDIEDMRLLIVQGKLSNLTVEERFAFNVSLRMFTRSIVIQQLVKDLQLGVESYQKRLSLTKPDTYRSDLKRREAYTAYSNLRGFIYQNKDKKNRAAAMIQAIDKMLKMRRVMWSLERFVGARLYEETSGCYKGPYDLSYADPIFQEEKSEKLGKAPTEMELILELTQQEHPSDTEVFTMKMEILLELTSNKLMVGDLCDSI